ncbi:MAG: cyclic nucleotide-binding domain-containing protein [Clostridia bacterium]|nr:cyclic nucleotide-binding domain-containing protein [Oscillospiraceae bacterium]MBO5570145.1 cyclic nucleotide-binding domain-containing protein [Clostridia bacterium]
MKTIRYASGDVIFREGDFQMTMYDIEKGSVGVYLDYDSEERRQLTVLGEHQSLGEMGLIEACPRSATAMALEDETVLREIPEEEFYEYLQQEPERFLPILRQLSRRIRENTEEYQNACLALFERQEAERTGAAKSAELDEKLETISEKAKKRNRGYTGLHSAFYAYVQDDLEAFEGKREVVQASLLERLVIRKIDPKEMHVNPDDEFADPDIGPSDRIINEYMQEVQRLYMAHEALFPSPIVVYKMAQSGYLILNGHHRWAAAIRCGLSKVRATIMNPPK